jgi:hypothetical protein
MMEAEMVRKRMTAVLLALALAAGTIPAAWAGSRVGIVLLPPMPVTTTPGGSFVSPALPGMPPGFLPPTPGLPAGPPTTVFTPPQAVPLVLPGPSSR